MMPPSRAYLRTGALTPGLPAWDHQPGEPSRFFAAFVVFRELGAMRTLVETAKSCKVKPTTVRQWAHKWMWHERATAWDRSMSEKQIKRMEEARAGVADRHARIAAQYLNVMAAPVVELGRRLNTAAQAGQVPLAGMSDDALWKLARGNAALLRSLVDTERLSHQMPTEHRAISGPDGGPVQVTTVVDAVRQLFATAQAERVDDDAGGSRAVDGELEDPGSAGPGNTASGDTEDVRQLRKADGGT